MQEIPGMAELKAEQAKQEADTKALEAKVNAQASASPGAVLVSEQQSKTWWTTESAMTVSAAVLIFGAIVVGIAAYLIRKERDGQVILKVLATILIITFSVFLIVAGWTDTQIGPAMGLLGTIAGYLLGKDTQSSRADTVPPGKKPDAVQPGGPSV